MNVRNRMADVVKLRCNACQDFLKMVIVDGWQHKLYEKAKKEVETNGKFRDKYIAAYEKMRDIGVENYSIDEMDVTFISEIVHCPNFIAPVKEQTRKSIEQLTIDRNLTNHSSENEGDEELYLRGLLALCNLKDFIRTVDRFEIGINDEARRMYRRQYAKKIDELKDVLDTERIKLIEKYKAFQLDINKILECKDEEGRLSLWCDIEKNYSDRYTRIEKDYETFYEFVVEASDAGIPEAHGSAINYYLLIKKDYDEVERRLGIMVESFELLPPYEAKSIIDVINMYLMEGNTLTENMQALVAKIRTQGYCVEKDDKGYFSWSQKKESNDCG